MIARVISSAINGAVKAPASKSAMQRYVAGALLANGESEIHASSLCDDVLAAIEIAENLGSAVAIESDLVKVVGGFNPSGREISCGESGLSARMFTPVAALYDGEIVMNGRGSILKRPLDMVEMPLATLGAKITSNNGFLPLRIKGPLKGGDVTADGSVSSQFITGLLMALPFAQENSRIFVKDLVSRPYIDLTISILKEFGITIGNDDYKMFSVRGKQKFRPGKFICEGDWSGAAFLLVMGAIGGKIEITGLQADSTQADKAILEALLLAGARLTTGTRSVIVEGGDLKGFDFDISDCPDLAPPLTVLALACRGRTVLSGAERLSAKESNRGLALEETMVKIGGRVKNNGATIEIYGGKKLSGRCTCNN